MNYDGPTTADYAASDARSALDAIKKLETRVLALEGLVRAAGITADHEAVMQAANELTEERAAAELTRREVEHQTYLDNLTTERRQYIEMMERSRQQVYSSFSSLSGREDA